MSKIQSSGNSHIHGFSVAGALITLGIIFGDIGTSPLYVVKAILSGTLKPDENFILGALSCIIWTLTLQTTLKYVIVTLRADNHGEGGIFSLYALIRRWKKGIYLVAIIGGSALLADGIITPAITVVSAVEGLKLYNPFIDVLPISIAIIAAIFISQQFGTNILGKSFGPIMFIWFLMLGVLGISQIVHFKEILYAFNPYYAIHLLAKYPNGFFLLGAVFLCTTGAEALYSDLGHCGLKNIRVSWVYVKTCLILNYLGQGAWVLNNKSVLTSVTNPFYSIMPHWFLFTGVIIATSAAIIACQALISGSFTIISEGILLNFWPKVQIKYPTNVKGQMYIPSVNWFLFTACIFVVLYFRESSKMEAAYGLSISITMLMTTVLLSNYMIVKRIPAPFIFIFVSIYLIIEGSFLLANLNKFLNGGWFTLLMASVFFIIMFVWFKGRKIKNRFDEYIEVKKYKEILTSLKNDTQLQKYATNLVYITRANNIGFVESKILFSILSKFPKRADNYWFIHLNIVDNPKTLDYSVEHVIPGVLTRLDFNIGYKVDTRVSLYFRQVIEELVFRNEFDNFSNYESLRKYKINGDYKFVLIDRIVNDDFIFPKLEKLIMDIYNILKIIGIPDIKAYGLDASNVVKEKVPLTFNTDNMVRIRRVG
jgi:KUP system potassium uptake protein